MAVTKDDFEKIWASTSPLTPYAFSDAQYKEGWNFIGGTPPSRQMWDFLQKNNDEKMQYLLNNFDNYLPLSGGTLTGDVDITGDLSVSGAITGNVTGNLTGNADTATNATNDANGNPIAGTYLPLSGGSITGDVDITGDLSVSGAIYSSSVGVLPGTVTAFSGTFKDGYPVDKNTGLVNREWHLCDGTNGTPDLRNRFIYGGDGSNNGATGGEENHKLTEAEIPPLNFSFDFGKRSTEGQYPLGSQINCAYYGTVTTNTRGGGQSHNNMPPYYTLAYIMKL